MDKAPNFDVVVAGGGPAGSTVAAFLAQQGRRVCLIDKDIHPRFHIGESLLPWNVPILERLGVVKQVRDIGVVKPAADFSTPDSERFVRFEFSQALAPTPPTAFQVRRSEFDMLLLNNAKERGAEVWQGTRVTDVGLDDEPVTVAYSRDGGSSRTVSGRFFVDATGRDTLLGRKLSIKERHPTHKSAAAYAHFDNVVLRRGADRGNISIYWFAGGWIWMIPLKGGTVSVGVVADPSYFKQFVTADAAFSAALEACPSANSRLAESVRITELRTTGNFSYFSNKMYGANYALVGDAFAFIDPVFSSGVYVAMSSGEKAAIAINAWLDCEKDGRRALGRLERETREGIDRLWWFIDRFNQPALRQMFMAPRDMLGMKAAVLSTLGGDIYGNRRLWLPLAIFRTLYKFLSVVAYRNSSENTAGRLG